MNTSNAKQQGKINDNLKASKFVHAYEFNHHWKYTPKQKWVVQQ